MVEQRIPLALGTEDIGKLLKQYSFPAIIAMAASSLYNIIDSVFIGHGVGALALSALALSFPLMNLGAAFGSLVGVGASTLVSVKLGQKDYATAQQVLGNVFVLNILLGLAFTLAVLPFLDSILYFFGASEGTVGLARDFMEVILIGNVVTHLYFGLNSVLRASGHPRKAMRATISTVLVNCALAPLFIFAFGWGIRGAALATILAQLCALLWQVSLFRNPQELLHFTKGIFRLRWKIVLPSFGIGMSPFLMNLAACLIVIVINQGLKRYGGDMAIGAYGIVNRLVFIIVMVVMGFNQGMQPIAGYNYGAKQYGRVTKVLYLTIIYATCVTTSGFLAGMFFPRLVVGIFTTDETLIDIAVKGLRIVILFFPIVGFQMVASNFFQSIGLANKAIFLSLSRQLTVLLPCLLILPHFFGELGVWYSMPVSDFMASLIAACMLWRQFKRFRTGNSPD